MPVQPSQDLETRFSVFLNPIRDLTKNWEVDIAKYLEDYLVELAEIQITFDGGVTVMNFAEAAMLIQGSATVYSKKVEFLWQMVLQMLDLLSSKRSMDVNDEDSGKVGGSGRPSKTSQNLAFERVGNLNSGKSIDLKFENETNEKEKEFKFLPAIPLHLVEKEGEKSGLNIPLYLKNKEPFGNKDDYRINRSYLTPSGLLCLDLPHEILQQNVGQKAQERGQGNDSIAGFFESDPSQDELDVLPPSNEEEVPDVDMADDGVDHGGGDEDNDDLNMEAQAPEVPNMDTVEPLEDQIMNEVEPVTNNVASDTASEGLSESSSKDEKEVKSADVEIPNGRCGLRRRQPKENIVEIKFTDPLKPLDPHIETPAKRPVRAGRLRKPLPCSCHKEPPKKKNSRLRSKAQKEMNNIVEKTISVEEFITKDLAELLATTDNNNIDTKNALNINPKLLQELSNESKRKQEKMKKDFVKERLALNAEDASSDEKEAEKAEKMKAVIAGECMDDYEDDNDAVPNLDFENIDDGFALPDPHQSVEIDTPFGKIKMGEDVAELDPNVSKGLNDSMLYEPASDYEALVQKWVSEYIANAQEHVTSSDLARRVNRWRKTITPKILEEEERKAFDIHEYGTQILSHFPSDSDGGQVPFSQVAAHEDQREVSRIFLSCLMLTNTYNIHLSNTIEGPLQMDCLELELLSRVRHHQELDEAASSRNQARPPQTALPLRTSGKSGCRSSPINRRKKKKRRKMACVEEGTESVGSVSDDDGGEIYSPSNEPSPEGDGASDRKQARRPPASNSSSKKLKTLSDNR